jgi:hypothetical protein
LGAKQSAAQVGLWPKAEWRLPSGKRSGERRNDTDEISDAPVEGRYSPINDTTIAISAHKDVA